jgi:predicted thioesterase
MKEIKTGNKATAEVVVDESMLAVNVGSGSLEVFATPMMVMLMEKAACNCVGDYLENDETTVGTEMSVKHTSATPCGMKVRAEAVVTEVNGREIVFNVSAYDETGEIGNGTHRRFLVYGEKFTAKTKAKLNSK